MFNGHLWTMSIITMLSFLKEEKLMISCSPFQLLNSPILTKSGMDVMQLEANSTMYYLISSDQQ
jgi:hypothetical protein